MQVEFHPCVLPLHHHVTHRIFRHGLKSILKGLDVFFCGFGRTVNVSTSESVTDSSMGIPSAANSSLQRTSTLPHQGSHRLNNYRFYLNALDAGRTREVNRCWFVCTDAFGLTIHHESTHNVTTASGRSFVAEQSIVATYRDSGRVSGLGRS